MLGVQLSSRLGITGVRHKLCNHFFGGAAPAASRGDRCKALAAPWVTHGRSLRVSVQPISPSGRCFAAHGCWSFSRPTAASFLPSPVSRARLMQQYLGTSSWSNKNLPIRYNLSGKTHTAALAVPYYRFCCLPTLLSSLLSDPTLAPSLIPSPAYSLALEVPTRAPPSALQQQLPSSQSQVHAGDDCTLLTYS